MPHFRRRRLPFQRTASARSRATRVVVVRIAGKQVLRQLLEQGRSCKTSSQETRRFVLTDAEGYKCSDRYMESKRRLSVLNYSGQTYFKAACLVHYN